MLNYIKAELWKVSRRGVCYALLALLVLCTALFFWVYSGGSFAELASAVSATMVVGMLAAPLLVQLVDGGGVDTLKNELAFGLGRGTAYWGKLLSALVLGLGFCLLLVGGCLLVGWVFLPRGDPDAVWFSWYLVGFCLLGALPIWCGMFALCHALALLVRSTAAWVAGYYLLFFLGQPILVFLTTVLLGGDGDSPLFTLLTAVLMPYSLLMPYALSDWLTGQYQLWCWLIGLGWVGLSTGLGLLAFFRRDVR